MARLMELLEKGVTPDEIRYRSLYDPVLQQEIVYAQLKPLEPVTDNLPRIDLWPGRVERTSRHSYHHSGSSSPVNKHRNTVSGHHRVHRPWRALTSWWPAPRAVVEIQIRGANMGSKKIPKAYHVEKQWYSADTGKRIYSIVERWRMCPM